MESEKDLPEGEKVKINKSIAERMNRCVMTEYAKV